MRRRGTGGDGGREPPFASAPIRDSRRALFDLALHALREEELDE
jgi:hypothetical protein